MIDRIGLVYAETEIELSRPVKWGVVYDENKIEQLDRVPTNRIGGVNTWNKIEFSWSIGPGVIYDKNQIGQQRDQSYRCSLHWKRY